MKILAGATLMLFLISTSPVMSREVTRISGYVYEETIVNDRDTMFLKIDTSEDGAINFKEFQKAAMLENEYEMFNMNDGNNDDLLSLEEYRNFSKTGPASIAR